MNCSYFRELASAMIDNEATDTEIREFNDHMATCSECACWYNYLTLLHEECSKVSASVPSELKSRVMKSVALQKTKKPSVLSRFKFTAAAAVIILVAYAAGGIASRYAPDNVAQQEHSDIASTQSDADASLQSPLSRSAVMPEMKFDAAPAQEELSIPDYDANYAFVILLHGSDIPEILLEAEFEERGGYRYYTVSKDSFNKFNALDYDLLPCDSENSENGLVIIKN